MSGNTKDILFFKRLREDDLKAVDELYREKRKWLVVVALSVLGSNAEEDAKDLVQDFFRMFWEKKKYKVIGSPEALNTYLYKSVYHLSVDKLRKKKVREKWIHLESDPAYLLPAESYQLASSKIENQELSAQLQSAMEHVPAGSAKVFHMKYLEEKSTAEITTILGINNQTVRNQISKALKILREKLKNC